MFLNCHRYSTLTDNYSISSSIDEIPSAYYIHALRELRLTLYDIYPVSVIADGSHGLEMRRRSSGPIPLTPAGIDDRSEIGRFVRNVSVTMRLSHSLIIIAEFLIAKDYLQ